MTGEELAELERLRAGETAVRGLCAEQMIEGADGRPTDADTLWPSEVLSALEGETVRWWERPQTP